MEKRFLFLVSLFAVCMFSCKKDPSLVIADKGALVININYVVNGQPLEFDTIKYTNVAGNEYCVSKLLYYVSYIRLYKATGSGYVADTVFYVDARTPSSNQLVLRNIPNGTYVGVSLYIGVDSVHNKTGALVNTMDNVNMAWPDAMGGGYHFMKLEGYFRSGSATPGYGMHLGRNANLVKTPLILKPFTIDGDSPSITLTMHIDEWYKNPEVYNFNTDGNYSMGSMSAMMKLAQNGSDVFDE